MSGFEIYLLGAAIALGSATAGILRGETGVLGIVMAKPPYWALALEILVGGLLSWSTVGFCMVQNAYRSSGNTSRSCGIDYINK